MKTKTKMKQKIKTEKTKQKKESRKTGWKPTKTNGKKRKSRKSLVRGIFMGRPVWKIAKRIGTRRAANRR
jgi:hypothetical protein